ncbi:hypothetical protein CBR_g6747 [Chara braunii]|uniref:Uncharacterized protein n=1 Tax=Chara braunii TaxID=69332 RepID=A0A388KKP8_CHABU|nr:hypothetical protein CBR_g6747 [Chara braunii]|eukprot:GBG70622.1 hypothetical protein CBR_g6747 [Chara braunii]
MYRVLEAKGELLLNDFLYDNFDCGQLRVLGGQQRRGGAPVSHDDARRDPRWGWVPSEIPFGYGRVKMQVRDIMGNVWSTHYVNDMFSFRHFDREATADEKVVVTCQSRDARIFDPPLGNPVELALTEGTVFSGEKCITYVHVRGKEATFYGICMDVWDHVAMRKGVVAASNITAHVIQEGQLYQHVARDMYGYHVNWVPGSLHPAVVDGKVTLAARMQSGEWLSLGWMHAGVVEHWQFLVVVTRISVRNPHVKDRGFLEEHAQRCWEKIREEERQMVCIGYDSHNDQAMWSIVEDSCTEQAWPSTDDMFLEGIRRRHGCTSLLGWVPVVSPVIYDHGEQMCMRFRDPLGVPFQLTYIDGLLRHIQYVGDDDARDASNAQPTRQQQQEISNLPTEVDGPETANDGGCSNAKPDEGDTPAEHVTGRAEENKKQHIDKSTTIMSMSVTQARATLQEVMQYAEEGIHYDDDGELELLTERVPSYFDVRVNIRASIAANGEESLRARMLLARFTKAHDLRVDNSADTSAYSLRKVVGWMCTEGMSDEGDVDMTKQQKGGTYMPADFKQTVMTQAKKWGMLKPDDRNVIHEALHDVAEQALAGKDLINYRVRSVDEDVVCATPLWDEIFMAVLHRLSIATSEVEKNRSREEGWKLVVREADVALHAVDGHTSVGEEIVRTVSIVRSPINTMSTQEVEEEDVFNDSTMTEQQRERGFEDSSLPIDFEYDIEETRVRNNEKDARAPNYEVEVSGSDVSSDEEGEEYDAYWDMEAGGGQTSKGWAHAILRLARVFSNPHLLLRVVLKEATPAGALQCRWRFCNLGAELEVVLNLAPFGSSEHLILAKDNLLLYSAKERGVLTVGVSSAAAAATAAHCPHSGSMSGGAASLLLMGSRRSICPILELEQVWRTP